MKYDQRNQAEIASLHQAAQHAMWQAYVELQYIGEDILITEAFRSEAQQAYDYASGRTRPGRIVTWAAPGWSLHQHRLAVDIAPVGPFGVELSKRTGLEWAAGGRYQNIANAMKAAGWEWGWELWKEDKPHFQYTVRDRDQYSSHLSVTDIRAGKRPDVNYARERRRAALEERLRVAVRALQSPAVTGKRKNRIRAFKHEMELMLVGI